MNKNDRIAREKELISRWEWLTEGLEYNEKVDVSMILENSYDTMVREGQISEGWLESTILNEDAISESPVTTAAVGTNLIPKVLFPMIRRVFPQLIANKLVSVQPISGPTGVIYYIIYTFTDEKGSIDAGDEYSALPQENLPAYATMYSSEKIGPFTVTIAANGNDTEIAAGTDISTFLGTDPTGFTLKRIEAFNATTPNMNQFSTSMEPTTGAGPGWAGTYNVHYRYDTGVISLRDAANANSPWSAGNNVIVFVVYDQEGSTKIPEMEFSIGSDTVTTTERKLKIRWTKESEQDMKSFHKIDVESELVKVASMEMNYEIDREVITFIGDSVISDLSFLHDWTADAPATGNNASGNFLDRHRALSQKMYQVSAKIATYNRQGPAAWAVVSPQVGALLTMLPDFKGEIAGGTFNVFEAGRLGSGLKIYVDPNRHGASANEILLGYKSNSTAYGAGVVYSPYVNWMSNVVTHPDNFNSIRGFFSRYALKLVPRGQFFYGKVSLINYGL
ncbi:MAG TPA: hypothetical protein VMZ91_14825 [Candidatus Paceibacterota bacterium]|nr:hypothetical protein [Candidatus Paceibacterota bacterium]